MSKDQLQFLTAVAAHQDGKTLCKVHFQVCLYGILKLILILAFLCLKVHLDQLQSYFEPLETVISQRINKHYGYFYWNNEGCIESSEYGEAAIFHDAEESYEVIGLGNRIH